MLIANILGIFTFFYLIWRNLKEDYHFEKVFNLGFVGLISFFLSNFISRFVEGPFWFWITTLFLLLGFLIVVKRQKMKFFETMEAYFVGFMPWIGLFYLADSINKLRPASFVAFWITFICIFIYFYVKTHYRGFSWYKSGRVGFAGIFTLFLFFLSRTIASLFYNDLVSMSGKFEVYLSGSASLLLLVLMYNLFKENG